MSDVRDPERDQQLPVPNDQPSCHDLVIADMAERKEFGLKKYGNPLQPFNGRSFLRDIYEELLDATAYIRGKLEEEIQLAEKVEPNDLDQLTLWDNPLKVDECRCVSPIPTALGYSYFNCANCLGRVPDKKLAHKQ